jgi:hypothetical protein
MEIQTLRTIIQLGFDILKAHKKIMIQINELDELRKNALCRATVIQNQRDIYHDKFIMKNNF